MSFGNFGNFIKKEAGTEKKVNTLKSSVLGEIIEQDALNIYNTEWEVSPLPKRPIEKNIIDMGHYFRTEERIASLGITLTAKNTGLLGIKGRKTNKDIATHLYNTLKHFICNEYKDIPMAAIWAYERHYNGSPHLHCILFFPLFYQATFYEKITAHINKEALNDEIVSINYLMKKVAQRRQQQDFNLGKLCRKSRKDYVSQKTYNCEKIKDVQDSKQIKIMINKKMRTNGYYGSFPEKIRRIVRTIEYQWEKAHCRPRAKTKKPIDEPVVIDTFILSNQIDPVATEKTKWWLEDEVRANKYWKEEDRKKQEEKQKRKADLTLRSKNKDRYHWKNARVKLNDKEIKNIRQIAKTCKSKKQLKFLVNIIVSGKLKAQKYHKTEPLLGIEANQIPKGAELIKAVDTPPPI